MSKTESETESSPESDWESNSSVYSDEEYIGFENCNPNEGIPSDGDYSLSITPSTSPQAKQFSLDVESLIQKDNLFVSHANNRHLAITIVYSLDHIPSTYLDILGMNSKDCVKLYLEFGSRYLTAASTPEIKIANAGSIQWQLTNCLKQFVMDNADEYCQKFKNQNYKSSSSYLIGLVDHFISRVNNPGSYCVNCDKDLKYQGLKPVSCGNALCYYQYTELGLSCYQYGNSGVTSSLLNEIKFHSGISSLLCYFAYACIVNQHRRITIFGEMPDHIVNECNGSHEKAFDKMKYILESMPSIEELSQCAEESDLKMILSSIDPDAYYFIRWIFLTCRAHLEAIDSNDPQFQADLKIESTAPASNYSSGFSKNIKAVFKYISNPPEREMAFNEISKKKSIEKHVGFHGSPAENWHSIVRNSLINYSGTKEQLHGAAYGSGIYFAQDFQTSCGYAKSGVEWKAGNLKDLKCMVFCEILNDGSDGFKNANPYYVISKENLVRTKYLIVM